MNRAGNDIRRRPSTAIGHRLDHAPPPDPLVLLRELHGSIQRKSQAQRSYTDLILLDCRSIEDLVHVVLRAKTKAGSQHAGHYSLLVLLDQLHRSHPSFAVLLLAALPASGHHETLAWRLSELITRLPTGPCPADVAPHLNDCLTQFRARFGECCAAYSEHAGIGKALNAIKQHVEQHLAPLSTALTAPVNATQPAPPGHRRVVGAAGHIVSCKPIPLNAAVWVALSHLSRCDSNIAPLHRWLAKHENKENRNALLIWLRGICPEAALGLQEHIAQVCGLEASSDTDTASDAITAPLKHATGAAGYLLARARAHPLSLSPGNALTPSQALNAFADCGSESAVVAFLRGSTQRQLLDVLERLKWLYPPAAKAFAFVAAKAVLGARRQAVAPWLKDLFVHHFPAAARWDWGDSQDTPPSVPYTEKDLAGLARDLQAMALPEPLVHALKWLALCTNEASCLDVIDQMSDHALEEVLDAFYRLLGNEKAVWHMATLALMARQNRPPETMDWLRGLAEDGAG